jgi:hypothetical protein
MCALPRRAVSAGSACALAPEMSDWGNEMWSAAVPALHRIGQSLLASRCGQRHQALVAGTRRPVAGVRALEAEPRAKAFFATINAANRYAVLWRIQTAVKAETRARRIAQLVEMLASGETIHIFKPSAKD